VAAVEGEEGGDGGGRWGLRKVQKKGKKCHREKKKRFFKFLNKISALASSQLELSELALSFGDRHKRIHLSKKACSWLSISLNQAKSSISPPERCTVTFIGFFPPASSAAVAASSSSRTTR